MHNHDTGTTHHIHVSSISELYIVLRAILLNINHGCTVFEQFCESPMCLHIHTSSPPVYITTDLCNDWDVRLTGGDVVNEGRLEVCLHQSWGTVSDSTWSNEEAQVVCRQLGYSTEGSSVYTCM